MSATMRSLERPQLMAVIEVCSSAGASLSDAVASDESAFRISPAPNSPQGFGWHHLYIDGARGEREAAVVAHGLLRRMIEAAELGRIKDFRIVSGSNWIDLATLNRAPSTG